MTSLHGFPGIELGLIERINYADWNRKFGAMSAAGTELMGLIVCRASIEPMVFRVRTRPADAEIPEVIFRPKLTREQAREAAEYDEAAEIYAYGGVVLFDKVEAYSNDPRGEFVGAVGTQKEANE